MDSSAHQTQGFTPGEFTSWSPGQSGNARNQPAAHDRLGRHVSYVPPQNHTYTAGTHSNTDSCLSRRSQTPAYPSEREDLQRLGSLSYHQLASLMNDQRPMISQEPKLAHHKPISQVVHFHGQVAITHHAGIPASTNNSALAALFMGLSHNRLADVVAKEVHQRLADVSVCDNPGSLQILECLGEALNTLRFDHRTHAFIPGHGLKHLRAMYQPGSALSNTSLDPTKLIKLILNDVYGRPGIHQDAFLSDQSDVRRKVAFVDITSDHILIRDYVEPSRNLDLQIPCHKVPDNLIPDNETASDVPDPHNPAIMTHSKAAYKSHKLLAKFTARVEYPAKRIEHLTFSFLQDELNDRYLHGELESDWHPGQRRFFTRSLVVHVTNHFAVPMIIKKKMTGYDTNTPNRGHIATRVCRRATNMDEMINDAWLAQVKTQRGAEALKQLLPGQDHCPQVLIVAPPNCDIDCRVDLDWHRDIHLPTSTGDDNIPYELSALISKDENHSIAWLFDQDGLIHCADAQGNTISDGGILPTVVTMPFPDSEDALQAACQSCIDEEQQNTYNVTAQRFANLGKTACLLIYRKKTIPNCCQ